MNDTILTAERRVEIADMINEIIVSDIMCREMHKRGVKASKRGLYADAAEAHESWKMWWNSGVDAADKLRGMGIPVSTRTKRQK